MKALVLFAHGSSIESANQAVRNIADTVARSGEYPIVEAAFLEGGNPDLGGALTSAVARGATAITVVPYFLTLGLHLQRDLPRILEGVASIHQGIPLTVAAPLDGHPSLAGIILDRAAEASNGKQPS